MSSRKPVLKRMLVPFSTLSIALMGISSCNVFDPLDSPGSDAQYLSAARACFDKGDYECAKQNYAKLSNPYKDTVNAEESFITLEQQGASMATFMEFVGDLSDRGTGAALTAFANRLASGAGVTKRQAIWNVYNSANTGTISNPDLKNFVVFISSLALVGELLAETSQGTGNLVPSHIAASSATCEASNTSCTTGSNSCKEPSGSTLVAGPAPLIQSANPTNSTATPRQLYDMIDEAVTAMGALGASGRFTGAVSSFNSIKSKITGLGGNSSILDAQDTMPEECFRQMLLTTGIGTL